MAFAFNHNPEMSMRHQFITLIATILLVGAATVGVNLSIIGAIAETNDVRFAQIDSRFEQVDARFEQVDARFEQVDVRFEQVDARFEQVDQRLDRLEARVDEMDRRMDERFRDMAAAIARVEGLIQGIHGQTATGRTPSGAEHKT